MSKVINIESVKDTILYKELLKRNNVHTKAFVGNIVSLCEEASDRAKQIPQFFSEYTLHDKTHFLRVAELMSYVLGDTLKELNDIEIGLLILSAFYHDQGMLIEEKEYNSLDSNDFFLLFRDNWIIDHANYSEIRKQLELSFISSEERERLTKLISELDYALLTDFLRESHGQRSHDYVLSTFTNERILSVAGSNISNQLAKICISHVKSIEWISRDSGLQYDENIGTYKVNTIFLSLVLRLADILDFDSDRTPDVLFKSIHFTSPVSISEWQKHRDVKGWEISRELIRFTMYFEHPVYEKTAHAFLDWIDSELNYCHALIRKFPSNASNYKLEVAEKVDRTRLGPKANSYLFHDLEFTLSRDEIVKLLMTDKLYKNTSLFIRELLQNSLDALRLRKAIHLKDGFEWKLGKIKFRQFIDSNGQQVVECKDNGCGMDEEIVSKFLGKVGRSYYRSPEFERQRNQLKEKGVDFEPCSQFGIGFMSCFMVGDRIQIFTRRDNGQGREIGKPLVIEINGLGGLIVIKEGSLKQEVGTTVRIFTRHKPIFFDTWSDDIRLLVTLKGYAMATEFPINAVCEIKEIKGEVDIPTAIDKKQTFLESFGLTKTKTIEVDLQDVNKNLWGYLRQTFLIDEKGLPCIENSEAKWETQIDNKTWKDKEELKMTVHLKGNNQNHEYSFHRGPNSGHSICLDGILVCGYPGRSEYSRMEMMMLGHMTARVASEHPFTLDVRGSIKPELNPAREPLDKGSIFNNPVGWSQLQNFVSRGSGILWKQVLNQTENGLEPEVFWKLLVIYDGSPFYINSNSLLKDLSLPIDGKNWIKLSSLASFSVNDETITATDRLGNKHSIHFPDEIVSLGKNHINGMDFKYWVSNLLICLSKLNSKPESDLFLFRTSFEAKEIPSDNSISREMSAVRFIPFDMLNNDYLTTNQYTNVANCNNPLVKIVLNSRFAKTKNEIQEFAESFVFNVCYLIQELRKENKPFTTKVGLRSLKYTSILFLNMDWSKYSDNVKPPYKIYIDKNTKYEITEEDFKNWARQKHEF
ncbi:HD domain-containing protein [Polluticaenibacter yanchengensis]|uniref:ATP-binding protein n=1 Tax=Polluticaenibacter yanchengensis TaxID=3014562 RepID=A0ABT4UHK2_9BACT|nr:ATP-binding protein [Chitinophagaceae bacterium LY-5]